jgi:hypothetical protein
MATQHKAVHIQLALQIDQCIRDSHCPPVAVASAPAATTILSFYVDFDDEASASVLRANLAEILKPDFPATYNLT